MAKPVTKNPIITKPTNMIPEFDGQQYRFKIPQTLCGGDVKVFLGAVQMIEDKLDEADLSKEIVDMSFPKDEMSEIVFDELVNINKLVGRKVASSKTEIEGEYLLCIVIN